MSDLQVILKEALKKPSPYGEDVEIGSFTRSEDRDEGISPDDRDRMRDVGMEESASGKSGSFIQYDQRVLESLSKIEGLTVMSIEQAREKGLIDGLEWTLVSPDKDKYTASARLNKPNGYFIHVTGKVPFPFQSCLFMGTQKGVQYVHNIIKLEEGASLDMITGCTTGKKIEKGLHIGITEIFIGKDATLNYTMLHEWGEELYVRPRTGVVIEDGGNYTTNYISLHKVRSVQMYPKVVLKGKGATTQMNSIIIAPEGSELDVGGEVLLEGEGSNAEIISRTVSSGGRSVARGRLWGKASKISAHLECNGIFLSEDGLIHAVPELASEKQDVDMSHEASVGKVAKEQVEYLMTRGLTDQEATSLIIRGFLQPSIKGLPEKIMKQVNKILESEEGL